MADNHHKLYMTDGLSIHLRKKVVSVKPDLGIKRLFLNKKAISPAIAAALLLAITIALVSAIGYVATNTTTAVEKAPQGVFNVQITKDFGFLIRQISGDPIYTGNLKLVVEAKGVRTETVPNTNNTFYGYGYARSGETDKITIALSVNNSTKVGNYIVKAFNGEEWVNVPSTRNTMIFSSRDGNKYNCLNFTLSSDSSDAYSKFQIISPTGRVANVSIMDWGDLGPSLDSGEVMVCIMYEYNYPWLQTGELPAFTPAIRFGQYTVSPGSVMKALYLWGTTTGDIHAVIRNWDDVKTGDTVKVMIIYTPTNQVIWQGEVVVG
ncbi:MAG: type IV pilin [Candidatus Bathyarchaeota archaeon]|nr:type IV pilin [Candidatus Bathyarchaeota archaeon]